MYWRSALRCASRLTASSPGGTRTHSISRSKREWSPKLPTGPHVISFILLPTAHCPLTTDHCQLFPGAGVEPTRAGSKPAGLPLTDPGAEGEGVEPSRLIARLFSRQLPSPIGLPFRKSTKKAGRFVTPGLCDDSHSKRRHVRSCCSARSERSADSSSMYDRQNT